MTMSCPRLSTTARASPSGEVEPGAMGLSAVARVMAADRAVTS